MTPRFFLALWLSFGCLGALTKAQDERDGVQFFEQRIRPLLVRHCLECHGGDSDSPGGNLLLDSREGWMRGGDLGPSIVLGDPDASLLIEAVEQQGERVRMPPDGRLSAREIADLRRWIASGAPDPRDRAAATARASTWSLDEGREFWSFQPLRALPWPQANDAQPAHPIDRWLEQLWRRHGLRPGSAADRTTLIRRAAFDLTGLPPSPAEIDAFAADDAPDAYERLLDRLLASPRYGERWGRFWLDVSRYADSNGLDENIAHGNAWRYRDYVIAAFNQDKPFDQFVIEQLAGDLLPASDDQGVQNERKIATGFLTLGPKVLAEVDETKMELDIIDEQVETFGRTFMALTLGCARCHDHKFDPVRTIDYYALAGVFKSTRTMEHFTKIARWNEVSLATPEQQALWDRQQLELQQHKQQLEQLQAQASAAKSKDAVAPAGDDRSADSATSAAAAAPSAAPLEEVLREIDLVKHRIADLESAIVELPTAMGVVDYEQPHDLPVHIRGSHLTLGAVAKRAVPAVLDDAERFPGPQLPADHSGRLELARWLVDPRHPLTARVLVNRLWRWHFGRGLVESTDNFGRLGEPPWHPELLDWLAGELIRSGWSIKHMHRLIMTSAVYQRASAPDPHNAALDPDNLFLWRANVRRLEAEAIRDALLASGGILNLKMGGSLLHVKNREFLFDHTSKDETRYDQPVRSVYLPVIRNHLYEMFQLFDYSDASVMSSNRATTTVAPQALFMLNAELVLTAADALATRLADDLPDGVHAARARDRIIHGYRLTLGRRPTPAEVDRDLEYLKRFQERLREQPSTPAANQVQAWSWLCQSWLAANEFIYVR